MESDFVRHNPGVLLDGIAWSGERHEWERFEDFDFEGVFNDLDGPHPDGETDGAADELRAALVWIWEPDSLASVRGRFRTIAARFRGNGQLLKGRADRGMARLLDWCFGHRRTVDTAFRYFASACSIIRPELTGGRGCAALARQMRETTAAMSKRTMEFRREFSWTVNTLRSEAGCRNMAVAASESWRKRHETAA